MLSRWRLGGISHPLHKLRATWLSRGIRLQIRRLHHSRIRIIGVVVGRMPREGKLLWRSGRMLGVGRGGLRACIRVIWTKIRISVLRLAVGKGWQCACRRGARLGVYGA